MPKISGKVSCKGNKRWIQRDIGSLREWAGIWKNLKLWENVKLSILAGNMKSTYLHCEILYNSEKQRDLGSSGMIPRRLTGKYSMQLEMMTEHHCLL